MTPFWSSFSPKSHLKGEEIGKCEMLISAIHNTFEGLGPALGAPKSKKDVPEDFFTTPFFLLNLIDFGIEKGIKKEPFLSESIITRGTRGTPPWGPLGSQKDP